MPGLASDGLRRYKPNTQTLPPPPSPYRTLGPTEFANTAREAGLRGSYTDPYTGVSWSTDGTGAGGAGSRAPAPAASGISSAFGDVSSAYGSPYEVAPPPARVAPVGAADSSVAEANAFARAKDRIGQIGRGALASLRSRLAYGGRLGGGAESRGTALLASRNAGELGNVVREQAIQAAERARQVADRNYQGEITQRSQDIGWQQAERARMAAEKAQRSQAILALARARSSTVY